MPATFINTAKQQQAIRIINSCSTSLLEGGSRSGKTAIIIKLMLQRAMRSPDINQVVARLRFNHAKTSLWYDTIPKVARLLDIQQYMKYNSQDMFIEFPNRSRLWVAGTDDKDRVEKVLGQEFATIFLNEVSQMSFDAYELFRTRLNPPRGLKPRYLLDLNPCSTGHWIYKLFHGRKRPDGSMVEASEFKHIKMNPSDNLENLSEDYIANLQLLSAAKRKRFLDGDYTSEEGSLWKRDWIKYKDIEKDQLTRIVLGVDPSGSRDGDEVGIIIAGTDGKDYYILDDFTLQASPKEWGDETIHGYEKWMADCIAAEKNFGGEMVATTITDMGRRNVNVKLVNAARGKIVRAEPISAMYERGQVYHRKEFTMLEEEYCSFKGLPDEDSPNRLDAAVWALTELSEGCISMGDIL